MFGEVEVEEARKKNDDKFEVYRKRSYFVYSKLYLLTFLKCISKYTEKIFIEKN
jgi:hypothetical protein